MFRFQEWARVQEYDRVVLVRESGMFSAWSPGLVMERGSENRLLNTGVGESAKLIPYLGLFNVLIV